MSGFWNCLLLCEGSSDEPIADVLANLLTSIRPGEDVYVHAASEVGLLASSRGRSVEDKLAAVSAHEFDLVFVHRDADRAGAGRG